MLTASDCKLVHDDMTKILNCVLEYFKQRNVSYYKKMQHTGYLRHLLLRRGDRTGEILVNLVTTTQEEHDMSPLKEALLNLELEGKIVGFLHILMILFLMWFRVMRPESFTGKTIFMRSC